MRLAVSVLLLAAAASGCLAAGLKVEYSASADFSNMRPLNGGLLTGTVYIRASGESPTPASVSFWLDKAESAAASKFDNSAPFDFLSPFDTRLVSSGNHVMIVRAGGPGGTTVTANFAVSNSATSPTPPTPPPPPTPPEVPSEAEMFFESELFMWIGIGVAGAICCCLLLFCLFGRAKKTPSWKSHRNNARGIWSEIDQVGNEVGVDKLGQMQAATKGQHKNDRKTRDKWLKQNEFGGRDAHAYMVNPANAGRSTTPEAMGELLAVHEQGLERFELRKSPYSGYPNQWHKVDQAILNRGGTELTGGIKLTATKPPARESFGFSSGHAQGTQGNWGSGGNRIANPNHAFH